jgi:hypothetical protein
MIHKNHLKSIFCLVLLGTGQSSIAATPLLNQNFETNVAGDKLSLPWTWSVETFANNAGAPGGYLGGFYPGTVTNPNIHAVVDGQSGAQGNNALKVYADYGFAPNFDNNQWRPRHADDRLCLLPTSFSGFQHDLRETRRTCHPVEYGLSIRISFHHLEWNQCG